MSTPVSTLDTSPYDLVLALMDGVNATVRVPRQMTEQNYDLLLLLVELNLRGMKQALVASTHPTDAVMQEARELQRLTAPATQPSGDTK